MNENGIKSVSNEAMKNEFFLIRDSKLASLVNEKGLIEFVSPHVPRIAHHPNPQNNQNGKHQFLGLLVECASANRLIYSTNLTHQSAWIDAHSISRIVEEEVISPEGTCDGGKVISIVDFPIQDFHLIQQGTANKQEKLRTISIFVKQVENGGTKDFAIYAFGGFKIAVFSRNDWSLISGEAINTNVDYYPSGWVRLSATYQCDNGAIFFGTAEGKESVYFGENKKQFYLYGPQLEDLSQATSYIPTDYEVGVRDYDLIYTEQTVFMGNQTIKKQYLDLKQIGIESQKLLESNQFFGDINYEDILRKIKNFTQQGFYEKAAAYYKFISSKKSETKVANENGFVINSERTTSANIYHNLAIFLAKQGWMNEAKSCLQRYTKRMVDKGEFLDKMWQDLNLAYPPLNFQSYRDENFNREEVLEYFKSADKLRVIEVESFNEDSFNKEDRRIIEEANLSLANLELIRRDSLALENIYIHSSDRQPSLKLLEKVQKKTDFSWATLNETRDFQQSIVETGYIFSVCPFTGEFLKSNQSFYIYNDDYKIPVYFYRFVGWEVFYLIAGGWDGEKLGVYFPNQDLVISMCCDLWRGLLVFKKAIAEFKTESIVNLQAFRTYVLRQLPKKIVAIYGDIFNLGHHLWNEFSGFQYLYETGILNKVDKFFTCPASRLEISDVFPEIPTEKVVNQPELNSIFKTILEENLFAVRITESRVRKDLSTRIYSYVVDKCSQNFLDKVEESKEHFPLLWLNLRGHNKSWTDQKEGSANIIKSLFEEYPDTAIVFDGFPDMKELVAEIKALIPEGVKTYDALDCSIEETIAWAYAVDVYVCVLGSGLTFLTWFANKPGVVHANHAHLGQRFWWIQVREDGIDPVFIDGKHIKTVSGIGSGYDNYDCNWKVIYEKLLEIVENL
jgi:hypothetical protein